MISARGASFFSGENLGGNRVARRLNQMFLAERETSPFSPCLISSYWRDEEREKRLNFEVDLCAGSTAVFCILIFGRRAPVERAFCDRIRRARIVTTDRFGVIARRAASLLSRRLLQRNKQIRKMERGCNIQRERVQINPSITLLQLPRQQRNWEAQQQIDAAVNIKKRRINQSSASLCRRL